MTAYSDTLEAAWRSYRANVLPTTASETQVVETERAFYAGAFAVLTVVNSLGDDSVPEERGVEVLDALLRECLAYAKRAEAG